MQYYYECIDIYEKLIPEVKKHAKILRKLDADYVALQEILLDACQGFERDGEKLDETSRLANQNCILDGVQELESLAKQKKDISRSLLMSINFHMTKFRGYIAEFRHEVDSESPRTSIEIERKIKETLRKRLKGSEELREDHDLFDILLDMPAYIPDDNDEIDLEAEVPESSVPSRLINGGHKLSVTQFCQNVISQLTFQEDSMYKSKLSGVSKQGALRIKIDGNKSRRSSMAFGNTPSPGIYSPRPKMMKMSNSESMPYLNIPQPSPSSAMSPMEFSPNQHKSSFTYGSIDGTNFSTMPSFSGSQESRHGRQRKFTQKAQQMFKENKLGQGRPTYQQQQYNSQLQQNNVIYNQNSAKTSLLMTQPAPRAYPQYALQDGTTMNMNAQKSYEPQQPMPTFSQMAPMQPHYEQSHNTAHPQPYFTSPQQANVRFATPRNNMPSMGGTDNIHEEDDHPWCYCGDPSYGDMIACDNQQCTYEWFHFPCVGVTERPNGTWLCPECRKQQK